MPICQIVFVKPDDPGSILAKSGLWKRTVGRLSYPMLLPANRALFSIRGGAARYLRSALIYDPCRRMEHLHLYFHEFRSLFCCLLSI
jgi:hypothetical protein